MCRSGLLGSGGSGGRRDRLSLCSILHPFDIGSLGLFWSGRSPFVAADLDSWLACVVLDMLHRNPALVKAVISNFFRHHKVNLKLLNAVVMPQAKWYRNSHTFQGT